MTLIILFLATTAHLRTICLPIADNSRNGTKSSARTYLGWIDMDKIHIASCSFGKDSIATILLALENNEPLDRAVFAEVMFDHERGISGEIPEHIEWIYSTAIPKLESMGVKVDVVKAKKDYVSFFVNAVGGAA